MTIAWTWQSINKQLETFESRLSRLHAEQNTLLAELISDSFLKLSQFSQLIAEKSVVLKALDNNEDSMLLKQALDRDWIDYHINLGLDYLAVFDHQNLLRAEVYSPELQFHNRFQQAVISELTSRNAQDKPSSFIYCADACLLIVLEPFISDNGRTGTIALAQNMADIVRVFFNFSKSGLGILIGGETANEMQNASRFLHNWKLYAWAVSDFNNIFPILKNGSLHYPFDENRDNQLHSIDKSVYLVKHLAIPEIRALGEKFHFVSINNETTDYQLMQSSIKRGVFIGILGLLGAEFILWLLLISPMNKLLNITHALHLLPFQEFSKAASKAVSKKSIFPDELTTLEESTAYVANELAKLHQEINLKNTSLQEQIHALTRSRSFLTRLFDNAQILIITQDLDFNILSTNKKFDALYNYAPHNFSLLFSKDEHSDEFRDQIHKLIAGSIEVFHQEIHQIDKNSQDFIITWTHAMVENERGEKIILSIGIDQTQQKKAERNLRWMANHDSLTGVGNRRFFNANFSKLLDSGIRGALVFIDVNKFKQINDIYGHNVGDQVLMEISEKLRDMVRSSDVICRFAGDEFIAILTNVDHDHLAGILNKFTQKLSGNLKTPTGGHISYSVSVGAALFPEHGDDAQTLVVNADMAMYNAKKKGLGYWHIYDANDEKVAQLKHDHCLIVSIKNALRTGAFKLVYQPIIHIKTGAISHHEVLIRMYDESGEIISPALFIPVAERSGEIRKIDEWVLNNALSELSRLSRDGLDYRFAINISAPTMQADDFPNMVFNTIERHQVAPDRLVIELTETAYIENFQQVLKNLRQITEIGVKVALDDFGVGFSSFTYLKMLPLSYVKLDGSYIQHLVHNADDQVFVKSLAAIIDAFGMQTIAEFVEDQQTLLLLASLGVTHGQGYHIGRPGEINSIRNIQKVCL